MSDRRVVITGIGIVSPLAATREATWERLIAGKSGAGRIDTFDPEDMPCKIAFQVPWVTGRGGGEGDPEAFDSEKFVSKKEMRRIDEFILYALAAAEEAVEDANWRPEDEEEKERTGVLIGSGIGGLESIYETAITLHEHGPRKVSPFFIPSALINLASGQVSIKYGFKGPNHSVVTACATGAHAIGDSSRLIKYGDEYEHAKARGAKIYAEVSGYGLTGDAYHITAPAEGAEGGYRAMKMALKNSGIDPTEIDYVNAHGTSTPKGDEGEAGAVERAFGDHASNMSMSSTKSAVGHLLGAAGAIESAFCALAIRDQAGPDPAQGQEGPRACRHVEQLRLRRNQREPCSARGEVSPFPESCTPLRLRCRKPAD